MLSTFNLTVVVLILLALCAWIIASKKAESRLKKTLEKATDAALYQPQFRCVLLSPCKSSCRKAFEFGTKPILISDTPKLPLLGCNAPSCECVFMQQEDRRAGKDRRDNETPSRRLAHANKRTLKDRRRDSIQAFLLPKYRLQY